MYSLKTTLCELNKRDRLEQTRHSTQHGYALMLSEWDTVGLYGLGFQFNTWGPLRTGPLLRLVSI